MKAVSIAVLAGLLGCAFVQPVPAAQTVTCKEKVLWSFGGSTDGANPYASVIDVKGTLYGTTAYGPGDAGIVFALDPKTDAENVLYYFSGYPDGSPGDMIDVKGILYGATSGGDQGGDGTVFAFNPTTGEETTLYTFCSQHNCADGANGGSRLLKMKSKLYGTASGGGANNIGGVIFSIDPDTGAYAVLYSFCSQANCVDGRWPFSLIDVNVTLYGTTAEGGGNTGCGDDKGCGTVFSLDPKSGAETVLHTFCSQPNCADGATPYAGLIDVNGILYGTTYGGSNTNCYGGCGTVFSIDPSTGAETVLYSFCSQDNCVDGAQPRASLIDVNGTLYGTTLNGGSGSSRCRCGTVFSLDPSTAAESVLYSFCSQQNCTDGKGPVAPLTYVNGKFYGTTVFGGARDEGTVFVLKQKP